MTGRHIVASVACAAIGVACYATDNGTPLWALILVAIILGDKP